MADIKDILASALRIGDAADAVNKYADSLKELEQVKNASKGDLKAIRNAERMVVVIKNLKNVTEDLKKAQVEYDKLSTEASDESQKAAEEKKKQIYDLMDIQEKENQQLAGYNKEAADRHDELTKRALQEKDLMITKWKTNTLVGKSYEALSGPLAKFAAGITVTGLALKAASRFADAARLRNNLMVASYGKVSETGEGVVSSVLSYDKALRQGESTAIRYGMANENISDMMLRLQRMVGEIGPESMNALTDATLAMAKVMGISGAQALDYVQARMDNFGGTAVDALESLNELSDGTVKYNKNLKGVQIRGDDVVRTIQDITNSNAVYSVDQRFLSQVLMRTSATLQAQGESYNYAQKQGENFTKALTSEAPEWMQIINAFDVAKDVNANLVAGAKDKSGKAIKQLTAEYAAELDKSKPGLSKKVQDILNAGYNEYDTTRLIGDVTAGTEIAMKSMSGQIEKLGNSSISTLASVYGKSHLEAEEMYKNAVRTNIANKMNALLTSKEPKDVASANKLLKDRLKISDEMLEKSQTDTKLRATLVSQYADEEAMAKAKESITANELAATNEKLRLAAAIKQVESDIANATNENDKISYRKTLEQLKKEQSTAEAASKTDKTGDLKKLEAMKAKADEQQGPTSWMTGDALKSMYNALSDPIVLAVGAASTLLFKGFFANKVQDRIMQAVERMAGYGGDGGGGGGGGGTDGIGRKKGKSRSRARNLKKAGGSGVKGTARSIMSKIGGGAGRLGKGLLKKIPGLGLGMAAMDAKSAYADGGTKGATKSLISSGGGAIGSIVGGALGSVVPVLGTAVGAAAGGFIGDALGGVAANMYDKFTSEPEKIKDHLLTSSQPAVNAAVAQNNKNQSQNPASASPMAGLGGDLGKLNPDGSMTLTINNFMDAFVQSASMMKQQKISS